MRVCSPQLGLSPQATLGGEVYDRETLTRLAKLGAGVEVILPKKLACPDETNLHVTRVPVRRGLRWYVSNMLFVPYIGRVFHARPFDLLRVHSMRFTGPAVLAARRIYRLGVPIVAHHHHLDRDRWTDLVERRVSGGVDMIITVSEFSRNQLCSDLSVPSNRVHVVYNGVSSTIQPLPCDAGLAERWGLTGRRVLLYLGSLIPRKNLNTLLRAMQIVCANREDVILVLVGGGACGADLIRSAAHLGIGQRVRFVGAVPEDEKVAYYNLAHVFVLPSRLEGFGLAAAEAMACAKPVVASRASALPEVVSHGLTGFLCDPDEPAEFACAIHRLLGDQAWALEMGQAGRERVLRLFQWDQAARRTYELYEELVGGDTRHIAIAS